MRRKEKSNSWIYVLIAIIAIIWFVAFKVFTWNDTGSSSNSSKTTQEKALWSTMISPIWVDSEVIINFSNWSKSKPIKLPKELKPTDSLASVSNWEMKLEPQDWTVIYLNWNSSTGKIKYNWNINWVETFTLISSDAWIEAWSNFKLILDNFEVNLPRNTIVNASQTQVWSAISVLKWTADIDVKWVKANIVEWNNFLLLKKDVKPDLKIHNFITSISKEYLKSDWFKKHDNWKLFNNIDNKNKNNTWEDKNKNTNLDNKNATKVASKYLIFSSPHDESVTQNSEISFKWKILSPLVKKITINNIDTNITDWNFELNWVKITKSEENFVYRVFDDSWFKLDKWVITIYSSLDNLENKDSKDLNNNKDKNKDKVTKPVTVNYKANPVDYIITNPKKNPLTTKYWEITIRWKAPSEVAYITVNWYRLKTYYPWAWAFRYHAFTRFRTLSEWKNTYTIRYYSKDWQVLNTNFVVIYKTWWTYSTEASL